MKLRARITIEVEAENFLAAASHEQAIRSIFHQIQQNYGSVQLQFQEVRSRTPKAGADGARKMRVYAGG